MDIYATLLAAEEAVSESSGVPAWVFGLGAFGLLLVLLFCVTRMNINR